VCPSAAIMDDSSIDWHGGFCHEEALLLVSVTDNCTGLMWQKETSDTNGNGQLHDGNDALRWCDALAYSENLTFAGHEDWRLPNVRELQSIVDYGRFSWAIDPVFRALSEPYWSSTSYAASPILAWVIFFEDGLVGGAVGAGAKESRNYVRAVRSGARRWASRWTTAFSDGLRSPMSHDGSEERGP